MIIRLMSGFLTELPDEIRGIYERLSKEQHPGVCLVTCADSRVMPELMTQSKPGDMFTIRNVGNMIPRYISFEQGNVQPSSEMAGLEFAIQGLKIQNIIVCGHSDCGAMKTLMDPHPDLCMTNHWVFSQTCSLSEYDLKKSHEIGTMLLERDPNDSDLIYMTKLNILTQIEHLKTYPIVREKLQKELLVLHAWYFDFELKKVFIYQSTCRQFVELKDALSYAVHERREKIVKNIVKHHIQKLEPPADAKSYAERRDLIRRLEFDFSNIASSIRDALQIAFFEEFDGLFHDKDDSKLLEMLDESFQYKLSHTETKELEQSLESSKGYYQHCYSKRKRGLSTDEDDINKKILCKEESASDLVTSFLNYEK